MVNVSLGEPTGVDTAAQALESFEVDPLARDESLVRNRGNGGLLRTRLCCLN